MKNTNTKKPVNKRDNNRRGKSNNAKRGRYYEKEDNLKPTRKNGRDDFKDEVPHGTNDDSFWNGDSAMFQMATNIPFAFRTGDPIPFGSQKYISPSAVAISFVPTWGDLSSRTAIANVQSQYLTTAMRAHNKGTPLSYDQTNVLAYLLAIDSIGMGIAFLQRVLRTATVYVQENKSWPEVVLQAQGVKVTTSLTNELANLVFRLDRIIKKYDTFFKPNVFPVFKRHANLCSYLYTDEPNVQGQVYVFRPAVLWQYGYNKDGLVDLEPVPWCPRDITTEGYSGKTISEYFRILEDMLDCVFGDVEDLVTLSGNMANVFGPSETFTYQTIVPETANMVQPADGDILNSIHNAFSFGNLDISHIVETIEMDSTNKIPVRAWLSGSIKAKDITLPSTTTVTKHYTGPRLLDIHGDPTDKNLIMKSTRLMSGVIDATEPHPNIKDYGTELIENFWLYKFGDTDMTIPEGWSWSGFSPDNADRSVLISGLYNISYAPAIYEYQATQDKIYPYTNTDRTTAITTETLGNLNEVAMMGAFNLGALDLLSKGYTK